MNNQSKREEDILSFWDDQKIFEKSLAKDSPKGNFVFFEGPPTANGKPGIHHVLARAFKDLYARFRTMQGYHVERKAGWDTQGLPVEIQVEKALGLSGKPDIAKYGVEAFNKKCQESVWQYIKDWEILTKRMGYWLDMSNPYVTYETKYIESLWWVFKNIWDQGLVYQGFKVVPHCPRCETALSSHEVAQGYKSVKENSVYLKFLVTEDHGPVKKGDYILSWTTTPWTLPGNVALAVDANIKYDRVTFNGENYILASALVEKVLGQGDKKVLAQTTGKDLVGTKYQPLFEGAIDKSDKIAWEVVPANFVTTEDGTGIVHTAVMYGIEDYELGLQIGLPQQHTVGLDGKFLSNVKDFAGQFVKAENTQKGLLGYLKKRGSLFKEEMYEHDYPFCWRCDTPLLYYAKDSWFLATTKVQKQLLKNAEQINWVPAHIKQGRFGEWLNGVKDWAVSRERYWGTPLPVWICQKCHKQKCIGSLAELGVELEDLHKPYIDEVTFVCNCGGEMRRTPEVLDAWFDSGSMPFAQYHYPFEDEEKIDSGEAYPADFISEAIDQTRGWFFTLLAVSTFLKKGTSYKNVICLGHINDAQGRKMSKSKGNIVEPHAIMDKHGADALRFFLYTVSQPGEAKRFDERQLLDVVRKVFMLLGNITTFYQTFARDEKVNFQPVDSTDVMDRWIVELTNQVIEEVTADLDNYRVTEAARRLADYINELSTWYIRRSRGRFKEPETKQQAIGTLAYVLKTLSQLLAPFAPFSAENLWQELKISEQQSVHLSDWPVAQKRSADVDLLRQMQILRKIVEAAHAVRAQAGLKIRQPLAAATIKVKLSAELLEVLKEEINVQNVEVVTDLPQGSPWMPADEGQVALNVELTEELKNEGTIRELVRQANTLRKQAKLTPQDQVQIIYQTDSTILDKLIQAQNENLAKATISKPWKSGVTSGQQLEAKIDDQLIVISLEN